MSKYVLIGSAGCGSVIIELAFARAKAAFVLEQIPYIEPGPERDRLLELNPLGQVPTLILPDGNILTESAAIILHLADAFPDAGLAPSASDPHRPQFLRWLVYIVGAIYPVSTFGDDPARWGLDEANQKKYRDSLEEYRLSLWKNVEEVADEPWFLGENFSAIDLYLAVMRNWRPGLGAFNSHFPKLAAIADKIGKEPAFAEILDRDF
ncbi:glutathione S-transferase family protein [Phyllobacterium sp. P30BS-XVII]|uniref:glutathione S-transferase family protein n=1 Tax=Phyllobacterium sp. P30BS-XVII TaxID=2587046 RepID=UPI0015FBE7E3|nr:glutathione S-transferase family protein [Phyllobacterium sp. P30BS-XVII]MBA8902280.1 GST-like protein [Phyllobacterium sp. P30BS-XVII]